MLQLCPYCIGENLIPPNISVMQRQLGLAKSGVFNLIFDPFHTYRHSLGGSDVGSPQQSSGGGGGEYHSSQGDSHGFRGLAPLAPNSPYGSYNSPSNSWGDHTQNIYRQGGGGEMGWNSLSPYEQGQRRSSGGSGYAAATAGSPSPGPHGGDQSSWSYGAHDGYDEQWSNQQFPWRTQW